MTTASCGSCSFCCFVMAVPDIGKPACVWCTHAKRPHGGCAVYGTEEKPGACDDFACLWLVSQSRAPEERFIPGMRPDRSKVMFHDARIEGQNVMYVHVDPAHPGAWQWEPVQDHIKMVLDRGCGVEVIIGHRHIKLDSTGVPVNGAIH